MELIDAGSGNLSDSKLFKEYLKEQLEKWNVKGISGALILPSTENSVKSEVAPFASGKSDVENDFDMDPSTWLQFASISKMVGAVYAIELFQKFDISMDSPVNNVLAEYGSPFRLTSTTNDISLGDEVTFRMLLSHTAALGMHYVNGIPLSEDFPPILDLLTGKYEQSRGYDAVFVKEKPGCLLYTSDAADE